MKNQSTAVRTVAIDKLTPDPANVRKHFDELQAKAKKAGLLAGGKKPTPQKKGAETRAESEAAERKAEAREASRGEKLQKLVQDRLYEHLVRHHLRDRPYLQNALVLWLSARQPDGRRWGRQQFGANSARAGAIETVLKASSMKDLPRFLAASDEDLAVMRQGLASAAINMMSWGQAQALAMHLQVDLAKAFTVDADYLAIQSLDQLKELGRLGGIEDANKMTGKALKAAILGSPEAIATLGVPADVIQVYSNVPEVEPEEDLDDFQDDDEDEDTGEDTPIEEQAA